MPSPGASRKIASSAGYVRDAGSELLDLKNIANHDGT